ncbi:MAG: tungsten ABC transporter substrate-binding protein [Gammaproteobacteria bacterium]|nr:MAG: tungsten ABC transporter substrate-binding protein [Gammaproteobacteria bacterium]
MKRIFVLITSLVIGVAVQAGEPVPRLRLATTTSTLNSGLLDRLNPVFEKQCGCHVDVIAVGTGKALRLGANGDVDVVLVHAPEAEERYLAEGAFVDRRPVMHNDFVIVGPKSDPARLRQQKSAAAALKRLAAVRNAFISRGDDSGTNKKEIALWRQIGINPSGRWYLSVGQGMGATLQIASEKQGYTLTDRGTWLAMKDRLDLEIAFEGDPLLYNPYHVMMVNPQRYPDVQVDLARAYIDFLTGPEGQRIIAEYRLHGEQLFHPDALD